MTRPPTTRECVVGRGADGRIALREQAEDGITLRSHEVDPQDWPQRAREIEDAVGPRWVLPDAATWCPALLDAGVVLARCHDLRLAHRILARSVLVRDARALREASAWETPEETAAQDPQRGTALFELDAAGRTGGVPQQIAEVLAEHARQQEAVAQSAEPSRLRLLLAAESAGALVAAEMHAAGIPWDVAEHDRLLTESLGPRPRRDQVPARMAEVGAAVRAALEDPILSLDSPPRVLRALRRGGIDVSSTSQWELAEHDHPAIPPLLEYKKMARLLTANGWHWLDQWVHEGRYRPVYVPGGVVTGRWASSGGGALQIPRRLRPALRADPGWRLVSADVSQLEPRVLAAMSGDRAMAAAGAGQDLYSGIVEAGIVATRQEAKVGVLGALYGGTTGDSARVVPRLRERFPRAMRLVDDAAAEGERGGIVSTWLGRSSPPPEEAWSTAQRSSNLPDAGQAEQERARRSARDRGRFTRNFVVQGTAAEWALSWMAALRLALAGFPAVPESEAATPSGPAFAPRAHLAYFLHDEVIVHAPASQAEAAAAAVREAADGAGRLLFPGSPVDFPLDLQITERQAEK
ncbi:bifunctional 3'-5' exonuclease/DNA polymerase [Brachybacterium endophyticum]|uniref:bifunctional 3'-5' exonuclease/DNA polymerase n=1 Tax=Brachybacterium endophyticum TaxID=2182385 RepID=UPI0014034BF1|nr:bifunctional 3'-5' exonuclease/DNA polymerase [Brachybacterium endophyticum]